MDINRLAQSLKITADSNERKENEAFLASVRIFLINFYFFFLKNFVKGKKSK